MTSQVQLMLYVAGETSRSRRAIANLRRICDERFGEHYELGIVDVEEDPDAAELAHVLATPTLVKKAPAPSRRMIGDLDDAAQVLLALALEPGSRENDDLEDVA
jgi:circadian clock protein KaiB